MSDDNHVTDEQPVGEDHAHGAAPPGMINNDVYYDYCSTCGVQVYPLQIPMIWRA